MGMRGLYPLMRSQPMPTMPVMPAAPAPRAGRVKAIGTVPVRTPPAAAPAIADPAHLLDICGLADDLPGLRNAVRHRGSAAGGEGDATERGQGNNSISDFHGSLLLDSLRLQTLGNRVGCRRARSDARFNVV